MAREIVACTIVLPLIEKLADPDWWNKLIEEKAGAAVREQKMVNQLREALDAAPASRNNSTRRPKGSIEISAETGSKEFDRFLKSIKRCATIGEARRLRSDVDVNMRRSQLALAALGDAHEAAQRRRAAELTVYIERLVLAQQRIDKRLQELGGESSSSSKRPAATDSHISLYDVLQQPGALPLFMEFMDRRHRLPLVEYYLTVEGLKVPLEDLESSQDLPDQLQLAMLADDLQMLWSTYFATGQVRLHSTHVNILRAFCTGATKGDAKAAINAKRSVYAMQREAYETMESDDFPDFTQSALFLKASAALGPSLSKSTPPPALVCNRASNDSLPHTRLPPIARTQSFPVAKPFSSPPLSSTAFAPSLTTATLQRTDTAPPQVTVRPAFDRVSLDARSTGSAATSYDESLNFLLASPALEAGQKPIFDDLDEVTGGEEEERENELDYVQVQTIEAIQDALNSILEVDSRSLGGKTAYAKSTASLSSLPISKPPTVVVAGRRVVSASPKANRGRSLASRPRPASPAGGRVNAVSMPLPRRPIFDDDEDAVGDVESARSSDNESETEALAPLQPPVTTMIGDLELQKELDKLDARSGTLRGQKDVLEALVRKAELTGNVRELKLLGKSRNALRREIRGIEYQRAQLEAQAAEHRLVPGRVAISISGTTIGEAQGKSFVLYLVEVHQLEEDGGRPVSGWFVTRRYSEFDQLDRALKDKLPNMRTPELPSKHIVTSLSGSLVEGRRLGLERYLQALVKMPAACASSELRTFLSQSNVTLPPLDDGATRRLTNLLPGQGLVRTLYRSLTTGIDDIFSGSSMMDAVVQRLNAQATVNGPIREEDLASSGMLATALGETTSGVIATPLPSEGLTAFTGPLCDFFVELFGLEAANNWLRRQAILIVLQQVLGGTIERKLRDSVKAMLTPSTFVVYVDALKDAMFPDGAIKPPEPQLPRTPEQKAASRDAAARSLSAIMPAMAASIIGRNNARRAARNIFAILQSARLNRHLLYLVIDDILDAVFPELKRP